MQADTLFILEDCGFTRQQALALGTVLEAFVATCHTVEEKFPLFFLEENRAACDEMFNRELELTIKRLWADLHRPVPPEDPLLSQWFATHQVSHVDSGGNVPQ